MTKQKTWAEVLGVSESLWAAIPYEAQMQIINGNAHLQRLRAASAPDQGKHSHYKKDVSHLKVLDPYRICTLFEVHDPCLQHALKKILCAGQRGAKDIAKDVQEAIDTLERWKAMREEDEQPTEAAC